MNKALTVMAEISSGPKLWIIFQDAKKQILVYCHTFDSIAEVENKHIYSEMMTNFMQSGVLGKKKKR